MRGLRIAGRLLILWIVGSIVGFAAKSIISVPLYGMGADELAYTVESASALWVAVGVWVAVVYYRRRYGPVFR